MNSTIYPYYVYALIDPRTDLPFYIGKGKYQRAWKHLRETKNTYKNNKIRFLKKNGYEIPIIKLYENLDEGTAYYMETLLILKYGRYGKDENGILTNVIIQMKPPVRMKPIVPSCEEKKNKILKIAESGGNKPSDHSKNLEERRLGYSLRSYIGKTESYDEIFNTKIRQLRPDWFMNKPNSKEKKDKLFELAISQCAKPNDKQLQLALRNYLNANLKTYDKFFDDKIRQLRPDWFLNKPNSKEKKDILLKIAINGGKRPRKRSKDKIELQLATALGHYINKNSSAYDYDFLCEIKSIRPDWFQIDFNI